MKREINLKIELKPLLITTVIETTSDLVDYLETQELDLETLENLLKDHRISFLKKAGFVEGKDFDMKSSDKSIEVFSVDEYKKGIFNAMISESKRLYFPAGIDNLAIKDEIIRNIERALE